MSNLLTVPCIALESVCHSKYSLAANDRIFQNRYDIQYGQWISQAIISINNS